MKKIIIYILMIALAVQSIFTPLVATAETQGNTIRENILTNAVLTFENTSGQQVNQVDRNTIISVKYDWELPNGHGYKNGATFQFQLPRELVVYESIKNTPILFNGTTIGTLSVDYDGTAKIVFNDFIETHSNIKGTIEVLTKISETITVTEDKKVTVTPITGGNQVDIPINFKPVGPTIEKKGIPNKAYNTDKISWTIDFNKNLDDIHNAVLTDLIQDGQKLDQTSVKIYKLITKLDGSVSVGEEVLDKNIGQTSDGKDFQILFGDIKSAYRVTYTTTITDQDKTRFDNKAVLSGEHFTNQEASASVSVQRGIPLAKKSTKYDPSTQTITWEIKYNYNEKNIPQANAILTDLFNDSQVLLDGSFIVKKVTIDSNGNESSTQDVDSSEYTITPKTIGNKNGFELQFKQDIHSAYKIVYQTKAKDRVFDNEKITNTVNSSDNKATGSRDISQQILSKWNGRTNYNDKTTTWNITFNNDKQSMKNVVLTDTFTNKGLILLPDTLLIYSNKAVLQLDKDYKLEVISPNEFKIKFLSDINDPITITYKTKFNYEDRLDKSKNYLENKATIVWNDENDKEQSKEASDKFIPDTYTQSNGFKNGSYNAIDKEITWIIGINYNQKTISNPSVVDTIKGNQQFLPDSVKIFKMKLTGETNGTIQEELVPNEDYSVHWDESKKQLKVIFNKEIDAAYLITYKTSLNEQLISDKYYNTASIYDGENKVTDLSASVSVPHGGEYVSKSGQQNGKIIDWKANINFGQSFVTDAVIIDTPSNNQTILENSFHLYSTSVAKNGDVSKGSELKQGKDYKLAILKTPEGAEYFTISFLEPISKPYILEYQSMIQAKVGDVIHNDIQFKGKEITTEITKSESSVTVKHTTGMGTGEGELGSLEVTKVDADSKQVLEGATFSLIDEQSGAIIKTLTTGKDGKVKFDKLLLGNYLLKENHAPEGYVVGIKNTKPIEIKTPFTELVIENEKINRAIELTKVDKDNPSLKLQGAEFDLQRIDGTKYTTIGSYVTDKEGKITLNNIEPGDYQFVETKAPKYYLLDDTPITFTIDQEQTSLKKVVKTNIRGTGKLTIIKKDAADKKLLEGATFEIYNSNNELVDTVTTDADGKISLENLPYDQYTLKEIMAPDGYAIDHSDIQVIVEKGTNEITVKNNKIIHAFKLEKVDANHPSIKLKGAVFKLLYKQDATDEYSVVKGKESLTSDANGEIYVENLDPGYYELIETKAPSGYQLDSKPLEFEIKDEQINIISLIKTNKKIPSKPGGTVVPKPDNKNSEDRKTEDGKKLPKTGEELSFTTLYVGSGLILIGMFIMFYRRKRNS